VNCDTSQLILGSDDEKALRKAMRHVFSSAKLVACTRHLKENVNRFLTDKVGMNIQSKKEIIKSIFGQEGIASSFDTDSFDDKIKLFSIQNVSVMETSPSLSDYLRDRIYPLLRDNVVAHQPGWTNNNAESMNHVLKQCINWKPQLLPDLIKKLQGVVDGQLLESQRAIFGRGDFKLKPSHMHMRVTVEAWESLSASQRQKITQKCSILEPNSKLVTSTNGKLTVIQQIDAGKKANQTKRKRNAKTTTNKKSKIGT
jgi:hypothetical protein